MYPGASPSVPTTCHPTRNNGRRTPAAVINWPFKQTNKETRSDIFLSIFPLKSNWVEWYQISSMCVPFPGVSLWRSYEASYLYSLGTQHYPQKRITRIITVDLGYVSHFLIEKPPATVVRSCVVVSSVTNLLWEDIHVLAVLSWLFIPQL